MNQPGPSKIAQFIKQNPRATQEELLAFAKEYGLSVSISAYQERDRNEPEFGRLTYTQEDVEDMRAAWREAHGDAEGDAIDDE